MATLTFARTTLLALKADVARTQQARSAALALDPQANVATFNATLANLEAQITTQRSTIRSLSAATNASSNNAYVPIASSAAYDPSPTAASTNAVQSGGVFTALAAKQDLVAATSDATFGGNLALGTLTARTLSSSQSVTGTLATAAQPGITRLGTLAQLAVGGAGANSLDVENGVLFGNGAVNRVCINTKDAGNVGTVSLVVNGDMRASVYRASGNIVLGDLALGNTVQNSSLQTLGNLTSLTIAGNVTHTSGTAALRNLRAPSITVSANVATSGIRDDAISVIGGANGDFASFGAVPQSNVGGAAVAWNRSAGSREISIVNNDTQGNGFVFRHRTGAATSERVGAITRQGIHLGNEPPVVFVKYSLGTAGVVDTNYNPDWWHPTVVQWRFGPGNIYEIQQTSGVQLMHMYFSRFNGQWRFHMDFASDEPWEEAWAVVMFVSKYLTGVNPNQNGLDLSV